MISAGETKVAGPFLAKPLSPTTDSASVVANADGTPSDYEGERIETCSDATGTKAINEVQLTAAEAQAIRTQQDIAKRFLHLNADKMTPGSYCLYYRDAEQGLSWAENLDCSILGETWLQSAWGWLPGTDHTRCQQVQLAMAPDYKPTVLKAIETVAYAVLGAVTMVAGGYGFFMGGDIYHARKAAKVAKAAAKAEAAVAKKAAAKVAEEVADIADGKVARAAVGKAVEEGAEHSAAPILRAVTSEAAEEGVEHGVGTGARVAVRKAVGETVEAGARTAGKKVATTALKGAAKGLGIFAGFGVALVGGLLFPDEAEASEADRATFGEAFDNYGDFDESRIMTRNCEQSTLCYIGHWALEPVGIIADFSSENLY